MFWCSILPPQVSEVLIMFFCSIFPPQMSEVILSEWREEYFAVHKNVVTPLSRKEVVAEAQGRGIQVTEETFSAVYRRYNAEYKMVRNACQILACPFYLVPNRRFNQHLAVERMAGRFPQALHLVCKELCGESVSRVLEELASGSHSGRQGRKKCPVNELQSLQKLEREIKELLQIYKRQEFK
ncbi:hypothetical protein GWK47_031633 [Chionoecetes opilio]|uniref:Uncharacterized protein n=1 Tax=Chionoecetes opilio TaxID=41210 RepID=A0A8J4YKG9_CHIOP|nr:hypothetical protein GWK47_031633 [Chionoecetes opilio]